MADLHIIAAHPGELDRLSEAIRGVQSEVSELKRRIPEDMYLTKGVLTHREVARYLEVECETVLRYIKSHGLPASKIGRTYYVRREKLEDWLVS